jgi:peptidyl-prolyl cis-trans isomerase SurA
MSRAKPKLSEEELALMPFAQREGLPECSGGLVLRVRGETITSDEIITEPLLEHFRVFAQNDNFQQFKERAKPQFEQIVASKVSDILIYQQAKKDAGEQIEEALEKAAEAEVRKFIVSFEGDYARAEQAIKQMGMDWAGFKEYQKKMILTQHYIASQFPESRPVTHSELVEQYQKMKDKFFVVPAKLKFRLIDIEAAKLKVSDPNQTRQQLAKDLANELVGRIQAGEDFGELARRYSHGHRRLSGGLWRPVQPESLAEPYDVLAGEAEKIRPGQIAGPIETGGHIFIMKLEEKQQARNKPFEAVQKQVKARIVFERRKAAIDELGAKFMQQAALSSQDDFVDFCLEKIYGMSNQ